MPENHKSLLLSFIFLKKKGNSRSGRVTCPIKWPGWTQKGTQSSQWTKQNACKETTLLFKWIKMHGARGEENRPGNERTMAMFEGLLSNRSVLPSASALSPYSLLAFFFWVSPLQSSSLSLSLLVFCTFFFTILQILYAEKWKQRPKRSPYLFPVSLLLFIFFLLSLLLPAFPIS